MDEYRKYEPIFGSWKLEREIGKGSFSKVFEISREEFGVTQRAALKIINVPQAKGDIKIKMNMGALQSNAGSNDNAVLCLGIESSCDETSAAIVDSNRNVLSHIIYSQIPEHQKYGGVVPELAARAHILAIDQVINQTLQF